MRDLAQDLNAKRQESERVKERNANLLGCAFFVLVVIFATLSETALGLNL